MKSLPIPAGEHVASQLWREMSSMFSSFPDGVVEVPKPIRGTAFFPGGLGLWMEDFDRPVHFPAGQIMVVGQDFNSVATYERTRELGTEIGTSATWRHLRTILHQSEVSPDRCFFTNVYMGLRDCGGETGKFPGARDQSFVDRSLAFFKRQLEIARPKLVLTLGLKPIQVLASVFNVPRPKTLSSCTEIYRSVPLNHGSTTVVALTHPSLYPANVGRRKYAGLTGNDAEQAMIAAGLDAAFGPLHRTERDV